MCLVQPLPMLSPISGAGVGGGLWWCWFLWWFFQRTSSSNSPPEMPEMDGRLTILNLT